MVPIPPTADDLLLRLYGAAYWLLYHDVARDLFPGTPVYLLSPEQDRRVAVRAGGLIQLVLSRGTSTAPGTPSPGSSPAAPGQYL